jgi:hypothetical protein
MSDFDFLASTEDLRPLSKLPSIPDSPTDDFMWQTRKPVTAVANTVVKKAFSDELSNVLLGESAANPLLGYEKEQAQVETLSKVLFGPPSSSGYTHPNGSGYSALQDRLITSQLEAGGTFGKRLKRTMEKAAYSLPEAMSKMVDTFREFFTQEEQRLLAQQVASLDLPGFFQMFDQKVLAAKV